MQGFNLYDSVKAPILKFKMVAIFHWKLHHYNFLMLEAISVIVVAKHMFSIAANH